ncbi:hypothetical protein ACYCEW_004715 [Enterobacter hormaechei]
MSAHKTAGEIAVLLDALLLKKGHSPEEVAKVKHYAAILRGKVQPSQYDGSTHENLWDITPPPNSSQIDRWYNLTTRSTNFLD